VKYDDIRTPAQPLHTVTSVAEAPEELVNASFPWPLYKSRDRNVREQHRPKGHFVNCETRDLTSHIAGKIKLHYTMKAYGGADV
jgi:hypothetical protein